MSQPIKGGSKLFGLGEEEEDFVNITKSNLQLFNDTACTRKCMFISLYLKGKVSL